MTDTSVYTCPYCRQTSSGGGSSCPKSEQGYATLVSLQLQPEPASFPAYAGLPLSNAITAMIDTLVAEPNSTWTTAALEKYHVDAIDVGSEFGCNANPNEQACCSDFQINYSYSVFNYCFVIGNSTYDWGYYQCPGYIE